jgi:gas vesicle protein
VEGFSVSPGLIGGLIGAVVGVVDSWIISAVLGRKLREMDRSETAADKQDYERRITLAKWLILLVNLPVFTGIGYWVGRSFFG